MNIPDSIGSRQAILPELRELIGGLLSKTGTAIYDDIEYTQAEPARDRSGGPEHHHLHHGAEHSIDRRAGEA